MQAGRFHFQHLFLDFIAVRHDTAVKISGTPRYFGYRGGQKPAGTGFGQSQGQVLGKQKPADFFR